MASSFYGRPASFEDDHVKGENDLPLMDDIQMREGIGLGLVECNTASTASGIQKLEHASTAEWALHATLSSPVQFKHEQGSSVLYDFGEDQYLQQPWNSSTSFPTPSGYTSSSSHLSPATSQLCHSTRTSISSLHDSNSLSLCESFDPILATRAQAASHMAWSPPPGADVTAYGTIEDLSMLAASPPRSACDDYPLVFLSQHYPMDELVHSSNPDTDVDHSTRSFATDSSDSSDDAHSGLLMQPEKPTRRRRTPTTEANARFSCATCGMLFQRSHNLKMHHRTHDRQRLKEHKCPHADCDKEFDRKADLIRHDDAVHLKKKKFKCPRCDARFPRRDTLQRHKTDGCPKRHQLHTPVRKPHASKNSSLQPSVAKTSPNTLSPIPSSIPPFTPLFQTNF